MSQPHGGNRPLWIFLVAGLALLFLGAAQGVRLRAVLTTWPQVEAVVTQSRIIKSAGNEFNSEMTFRYEIDGQSHTATLTPGRPSGIREAVEAKVAAMPPGSRHTVRVDPDNPRNIIFNAGYNPEFFLMPAVLLTTGLVFLSIGGAPVFLNRQEKPTARANAETDSMPRLVGATFALIGLVLLGAAFWMGANSRSRSAWPLVEAAVTRSRVVSAPRSKGGTHYALELEFRYRLNGRDFTAPATLGDTLERSRVEKALGDFPVGSKHNISYNPHHPQAIQLSNEGMVWPYFTGAMGALFLLLGAVCFLFFRPKLPR